MVRKFSVVIKVDNIVAQDEEEARQIALDLVCETPFADVEVEVVEKND